jgi:hypothetical protein
LPMAPYSHEGRPGFLVFGPHGVAFLPADLGPIVFPHARPRTIEV